MMANGAVYTEPEDLSGKDLELLNDTSAKSHKIIGLKKFDRIKSAFTSENKSLNLVKIIELEK